MSNPKQCPKHNLPEQIICTGELCNKRIGCQLCIDKHDHKFYLDNKYNTKTLPQVQTQTQDKLVHLQKYTKSNINNLRLGYYKEIIDKFYDNELLYLQNKIQQEMISINLWIEKIDKAIKASIQQSKHEMLTNWGQYNSTANIYMDYLKDYKELEEFMVNGDWSTHQHVEKSVSFLYSEEMFFKFNRNLDSLKLQITHFRRQDKKIMEWFEERRSQFMKLQICPHENFQILMKKYDKKPDLQPYIETKTKQTKDDHISVLELIKEDSKAIMLYPQTMYEPFQNVYKLIRYDNQTFVTSGSRAINIWSRINIQPQKSYALNFPSYGILSFVEFGKDQAEQILYGKSNGELGLIDVKKQSQLQMSAHQAAIRDIIQYDSYHFLTASQDWKLKLWAMSTQKQLSTKKQFASERLTLSGHSGRVYTICKFGPSVLAAGSDGTIKLWDIMRQSYDQIFEQQKQIYALAELREQLFVSGGEIKQIRVWDYRKTKAHIARFPIEHTCNTILRYDDNSIIFNDKNVIKVIDIRNLKQPLLRMTNEKAFSHVVNSMAYLSDNQIGMGGSDNVVSVWKY